MNATAKRHAAEPATTEADTDSRQRCEHVLEQMLTYRGNPSAEVERVLADDPLCIFGHCLRAALIVRADDDAARPTLAASVAAIETACPDKNNPARRHAAAARAWLEGDPALAAERYATIVVDRPRDILALVVAHAFDFRLGRRRTMRDRIARVLLQWEATAPGYASILVMYAFGLEENGQYHRAERMARRALALEPGHPGAIHVIAHVMEMQGRTREGLAFLAATESAWAEGTGFSVHLAWHRALFHLDANNPESALATYDAQIANTGVPDMNSLADASALLWRLQLRNVDVSRRWRLLADRWERQPLAGARPFYVIHAMMAFAATGRAAAAARAVEALPHPDTGETSPSLPEETIARPLCEALLAFARSDYAACIEWLEHVRDVLYRCGGSRAQCDLVHLTFTEAALRARKARLAGALVAERVAEKPASPFNRLLLQRLWIMPAMV
jgi:hypothetical protein